MPFSIGTPRHPGGTARRLGGGARLGEALYTGALVASRHNPAVIEEFHELLCAAGKPKKVAL